MEIAVWTLVIVVLGSFGWLAWFLTRKKEPANPAESPFLLLQQQMEGLRGEFAGQLQNQLQLLRQTHQGIDQRLDSAGKVFVSMEQRMTRVEETTRQVLEVGKDISTLQQILKAPKLRGNFGEQLLADLLSQMLPRETFDLQYTFQNGERVDAVIKTAQGMVAIDAKFPLENFQRYLQTQDENEKKTCRKAFLQDVKKHVDDIASKYILPGEGTFDFALMYIPAENVYYEIITRDLGGQESASVVYYALKKKVIPVSPNTFYAYLQTILLGLKGMQVEKRVKEIVVELARLRKELGSFHADFSLVGKHLGNAVNSFEKSDKRLTRLEDKLSGMEVLPEGEIKEIASEVLNLPEQ
ncbi:MAG: DNA recombination protein RmuC [Deltaproteobacteria bacterium]|nr:DNA recombination protein RmuC [Deltaproteobacteria bacterium]